MTEQPNVETQAWRKQVERVREALVGAYPEINSAFREVHVDGMQALDALTTQIEELERERDDALGERVIAQLDIAQARAEKAERALGEMREALEMIAEKYEPNTATACNEIARAALRPSEKASDE